MSCMNSCMLLIRLLAERNANNLCLAYLRHVQTHVSSSLKVDAELHIYPSTSSWPSTLVCPITSATISAWHRDLQGPAWHLKHSAQQLSPLTWKHTHVRPQTPHINNSKCDLNSKGQRLPCRSVCRRMGWRTLLLSGWGSGMTPGWGREPSISGAIYPKTPKTSRSDLLPHDTHTHTDSHGLT